MYPEGYRHQESLGDKSEEDDGGSIAAG